MISLVRLSTPGAMLFFISLSVFLTSDVMTGGTSDESGFSVIYGEGCWSWSVELYSSEQKHAQIFSISVLSLYFIFDFTYLFLWSFLVYILFSSTTLKYSFNMICPFLS